MLRDYADGSRPAIDFACNLNFIHRRFDFPFVTKPHFNSTETRLWRIIYFVDRKEKRVHILNIDTRGDVYK